MGGRDRLWVYLFHDASVEDAEDPTDYVPHIEDQMQSDVRSWGGKFLSRDGVSRNVRREMVGGRKVGMLV